ncbi:uncharacterized protein LOC129616347 [Condylostylus longicornis]|uniref:uncharacterized protein LOC129616347 n=1 Tax=Condylostylus longicornis TaxID=2530218 RepID=UPI00244DBCAA|nr:uncharacterized protein LOC129616347 [Condylostylus longicornis]
MKASIVERFNRTLKNMMWKTFSLNGNYKWLHILSSLIQKINKYKKHFEKGYQPNWSTKIFKFAKVNKTYPITYQLVDYKDNTISGGFYKEELTPVKYPDAYLVEKIIKKQGNKVFVKWLGFSDDHNTWINKDSII